MTERKPFGETWESWVDRRVREAEERGEFENLPGKGQPIPGLDQPYDPDWWLKQFMQREGLSILPDTLQISRFVEDEKERIGKLRSEDNVRQQLQRLNALIREGLQRATSGPSSRATVVDVEQFITLWRKQRS